jgi:hypothetical protein
MVMPALRYPPLRWALLGMSSRQESEADCRNDCESHGTPLDQGNLWTGGHRAIPSGLPSFFVWKRCVLSLMAIQQWKQTQLSAFFWKSRFYRYSDGL